MERHGIAEIRSWRSEIPSVRYEVVSVDREGSSAVARVRISGDFPGSPVVLSFHFESAADGRISVLRIRS